MKIFDFQKRFLSGKALVLHEKSINKILISTSSQKGVMIFQFFFILSKEPCLKLKDIPTLCT